MNRVTDLIWVVFVRLSSAQYISYVILQSFMSIENSVKELYFISYFLLYHNSCNRCASFPLLTRCKSSIEAMIKEARDQAKNLREDAEMEARATAVVAVRPFGDAE